MCFNLDYVLPALEFSFSARHTSMVVKPLTIGAGLVLLLNEILELPSSPQLSK